jgi:hypothetical protein
LLLEIARGFKRSRGRVCAAEIGKPRRFDQLSPVAHVRESNLRVAVPNESVKVAAALPYAMDQSRRGLGPQRPHTRSCRFEIHRGRNPFGSLELSSEVQNFHFDQLGFQRQGPPAQYLSVRP